MGVIVRDSKGLVIAVMSKTVEGFPAPVIAVAMGALQAAEFSIDLGIRYVILEGDSLQVIQAINGKGDQWIPYGQIVADLQMVFSSFRIWEAIHTKGDANGAAHRLAKIAVQEFREKIWMDGRDS